MHRSPDQKSPGIRCLRRATLALLTATLATFAAVDAEAGDGLDCLACPTIDQTTCPALAKALARPEVTVAELGAWLDRAPAGSKDLPHAAQVLAILGGEKARAHLTSAAKRLGESEFAVDLQAAAARAGEKSMLDALVATGTKGEPRARLVAISTLASLQAPQAPALARANLKAEDRRLAAGAIVALGKVGTNEDTPALLSLLRRTDLGAIERRACLLALTRLKFEGAMLEATQLVSHPAPRVAQAALALLAVAPPMWSSPAIRWALEQPTLQRAAAPAAVGLHDDTVAGVALRAATTTVLPTPNYIALLDVVASAPADGAAKRLLDHAEALDDEGKVATLKCVARLRDRSVVPRLVESLVSVRAQVANFTVYALEELTGERLGGDVHVWRAWLQGGKAAAAAKAP